MTEASGAYRTFRKLLRKPSALVGLAVLLVLIVVSAVPDVFATHSPTEIKVAERLKPPSSEYKFGTDEFGRDIYSRLIHGAGITLRVGLVSVGIAAALGGTIGLLAGYFGGMLDRLISGLIEVLMAFPSFVLALAVVAVLEPSLTNAMIAVGIQGVPIFARLVRGTVVAVRSQEFVEAAAALGAPPRRIIIRHVLPNVASPLLVLATMQVPVAILTAAGLSFIGLGAQPPTPEWGAMLVTARTFLSEAPWMVTYPGGSLVITIIGLNLLGDALRDVLDPKLNS